MKYLMKRKTKKEPKETKSKDGVIKRNLDRIRVSAATPQPSNPSRHPSNKEEWKNRLKKGVKRNCCEKKNS